MSVVEAPPVEERQRLEDELERRRLRKARAARDPAYLISFMSAPDERTGLDFTFAHLREPVEPGEFELGGSNGHDLRPEYRDAPVERKGWRWQAYLVWVLHTFLRVIVLKARQLGATWICCGYIVWTALYKRGSLCLVYRQKEEEAWENVTRCHQLLLSLPRYLWNGAEVVRPRAGALATEELKLRFRMPNGRFRYSRIVAMTSASASGHGKTAAVALTDEHSRIERAAEIAKAVQPAVGTQGKWFVVSTANGTADEETGDGNHFHWLWAFNADGGWTRLFLGWFLHALRDRRWYETSEEVRGLRSHERAEQYPENEHEAFALTNKVFFEAEDLDWYATHTRRPLYRFDFDGTDLPVDKARRLRSDERLISVFVEPQRDHDYAISADVASGSGADYSAAHVIDLTNLEIAAELHGKLPEDRYAYQLHFLGKWYGTGSGCEHDALLAPETQGGYGTAVIICLRDRTDGRPAYRRIYRHSRRESKPGDSISAQFGWRTNESSRPKLVNGFEKLIRERALPFVTPRLLHEMKSFVRHDHGPSPAAQVGARDDCVLSACIGAEMYRQYGHHPNRRSRVPKPPPAPRPWQHGPASARPTRLPRGVDASPWKE
jgi:hypothetical protein